MPVFNKFLDLKSKFHNALQKKNRIHLQICNLNGMQICIQTFDKHFNSIN